jgi:hypothetical protein
LQHVVTAAVVFLSVAAAAVILHFSVQLTRSRLPRILSWTIDAVATFLYFLDIIGFVLIAIDEFWKLIPEDFRTPILHLIGRGGL